MCLFSFILPVYNISSWLSESLGSVLHQTKADWEALVTDDGSMDETGAIADENAANDPRVTSIHQWNSGVSVARNLALDLTRGDWFGFLDGDDFIHPQYLELCSAQILHHPEAGLLFFRHVAAEHPEFPLTAYSAPASTVQDISHTIPQDTWNAGLWTAVYQRKYNPDLRFSPYSLGEDVLFYRKWLLHIAQVVFLDCHLYAYRQREGSAVHSTIDVQKTRDSLGANSDCLFALLQSGKDIPWWQYTSLFRTVLDVSAYRCADFASSETASIFALWMSIANRLAGFKNIPSRHLFRIRFVLLTHSRVVWKVLMAWPFRLRILYCQTRDFFRKALRNHHPLPHAD